MEGATRLPATREEGNGQLHLQRGAQSTTSSSTTFLHPRRHHIHSYLPPSSPTTISFSTRSTRTLSARARTALPSTKHRHAQVRHAPSFRYQPPTQPKRHLPPHQCNDSRPATIFCIVSPPSVMTTPSSSPSSESPPPAHPMAPQTYPTSCMCTPLATLQRNVILPKSSTIPSRARPFFCHRHLRAACPASLHSTLLPQLTKL